MNSIEKRNYHEDIKIDPNNLEWDWIEQGSRYLYYAEAYADAIDTKDRAKQSMELKSAVLDNNLRTNWDKLFPDLKLTETSVKSKILQNIQYKKALDIFNKAHHNVNLLSSAKSAFEHKKKALEKLVELRITGMYSSPKMPTQKQRGESHTEHTKKLNDTRLKNKKLQAKKLQNYKQNKIKKEK